jgi:hypothetical protein
VAKVEVYEVFRFCSAKSVTRPIVRPYQFTQAAEATSATTSPKELQGVPELLEGYVILETYHV